MAFPQDCCSFSLARRDSSHGSENAMSLLMALAALVVAIWLQNPRRVAWLVARHERSSNEAYFARVNPGILYRAAEPARARDMNGQSSPDVLYAVTSDGVSRTLCEAPAMQCTREEGMTLAAWEGPER